MIDTDADAETIARKAMQIAAEICVYTNHNVVVEVDRCHLNGATGTASGRSRKQDLPMLASWLAEPHIAAWWDDPEVELAEIREHIDSISVEPLIIELDRHRSATSRATTRIWKTAIPIRTSRSARSASISRSAIPNWSGSATARRSSGNSRTSCSPRARRASSSIPIRPTAAPFAPTRKAGFQPLGERTSEYGHVLLMARDADEGEDRQMTARRGTGSEAGRDILE